jgi:hypothetical protein
LVDRPLVQGPRFARRVVRFCFVDGGYQGEMMAVGHEKAEAEH